MTSFANSLKSEIARVARKEIKSDLQALRKTVGGQRSDIAALKKQVKQLTALLKYSQKQTKLSTKPETVATKPGGRKRQPPGPATLTAFRAKVGITQAELAKLLNASVVSVNKWEAGKTRPRAAQVDKIVQVVKLGKRAVAAQLKDIVQPIKEAHLD